MAYNSKDEDYNKTKGDISSTPAKPSERRRGSSKNRKGSASNTRGGIKFSEEVIESLKNKVEEHNKKARTKVTLGELKAVYRRGAGAFSTSHRPNMTRQQWAMARVNSYLKRGHSQDNDLRKADEELLDAESLLQDQLDILEKSFIFTEEYIEVEKGKTSQVTRDSHGNLIYRGIKFAGYGKPRKSDNPKKDRMVLVRKGDEVKIVRYGDASMKQNYSKEANNRFYDRFGGRPEANDKFSATYWSLRDLWPRGALKGKGAKPLTPLKKSEDIEGENLDNINEEPLLSVAEVTKEDIYKNNLGSVIIKGFDDEKMISYDPLYVNVGKSDAHGDGILDEDLDALVENINLKIKEGVLKAKIHHKEETNGFYYIKAGRMPMDAYIDNGEEQIKILEGQPILKTQYTSKVLWDKKKKGILKNPSIGGNGKRIPNPNYKEE